MTGRPASPVCRHGAGDIIITGLPPGVALGMKPEQKQKIIAPKI